MRLIFALALAATAATGCATSRGDYMRSRRIWFWERTITVQIVHGCTPVALVYQAGKGQVAEIRGGAPQDIPLAPARWEDDDIVLTLQSIGENGTIVGNNTATFWLGGYGYGRGGASNRSWRLCTTGVGSRIRSGRGGGAP